MRTIGSRLNIGGHEKTWQVAATEMMHYHQFLPQSWGRTHLGGNVKYLSKLSKASDSIIPCPWEYNQSIECQVIQYQADLVKT